MSPADHKGFPLALAQEDELVRILAYRADKGIERKMRDMGMPIGAEVRIVQHKGAARRNAAPPWAKRRAWELDRGSNHHCGNRQSQQRQDLTF
ncbi:FeoA domain-containing protein [Magnetovibrio sp. PR-2]|uniref:FeoA domain-containing protein n=1 Tax=Magnetovibrio sp. PR-2 TaxID=3120356 RepID=UPI002FCE5A55